MAESLKRVTWAKNKQNQDRVNFYLFQQACAVMAELEPDATELAFAQKIYTDSHDAYACAMVVAANATVGASIDADTDVAESDIEYVVATSQWSALATASEA